MAHRPLLPASSDLTRQTAVCVNLSRHGGISLLQLRAILLQGCCFLRPSLVAQPKHKGRQLSTVHSLEQGRPFAADEKQHAILAQSSPSSNVLPNPDSTTSAGGVGDEPTVPPKTHKTKCCQGPGLFRDALAREIHKIKRCSSKPSNWPEA